MALTAEQRAQIAARLGAGTASPKEATKARRQTAREIFEEGARPQEYEDSGAPEDVLQIIRQTRAEAQARTRQINSESTSEGEKPPLSPRLQKAAERLLTQGRLEQKEKAVDAQADRIEQVNEYFNAVAGSPPGAVPRQIPMMDPNNPDVPNLEFLDKVLPADKPGESVAKAAPVSFWDRTTDYITDTYNKIRFDDTGSVTRKALSLVTRPNKAIPEYDAEGNLVRVRTETDEEARNNRRIEMEAMTRANHADEVGGAAAVTAVMANAMLDPVAILTGRIGLSASGLTKLAALSGTAGAYTASEEALTQLKEEGGITDAMEVLWSGGRGAAGGFVIGGAFGIASKLVNKFGKARVEKKIDELELRTAQYRQDGLNPGEAAARSMEDMGLVVREKEITRLGKKYFPVAEAKQGRAARPDKITPLFAEKEVAEKGLAKVGGVIREAVKTPLRAGVEFTDRYLGIVGTQIKQISPSVAAQLKRVEGEVSMLAGKYSDGAEEFILAAAKLGKKQRQELNQFLANRDIDGALNYAITTNNNALKGGLQRARLTLDEMFKDLRAHDIDVGHLDDFFTRRVKDYKGLKKALGKMPGNKLDDAIERAKQIKFNKGEIPKLTNEEEQKIINNIIKDISTPITRAGRKLEQERQLEVLPPELLKYYHDPATALSEYINDVVSTIYKAKVLGPANAKATANNSGEAISAFIQQAKGKGEITTGEALKLAGLIQSRIRGAEQSPGRFVTAYKNIFYAGAIGNPLSAITQLGDLAVAAASQGIFNTLKAVVPGLGQKIGPKTVGVMNVAQEMASTGGTARFLNKWLKVSGFRAIDTFGKRTLMSAAWNRTVSAAKTTKGSQKWLADNKWMFRSEDEALKTMQELSKGKLTENGKLWLYNQLAGVQPTSLLEVPAPYLDMKNGRIFYALKTFMLKQLDIQREFGLNKIRQGKVAEGAGFLARYYGLMALGGATTAQIQNLILGRDEAFTDGMASTLMKNFALSEYTLKDLQKGHVSEFLANTMGPPVALPEAIIKDIAQWGRDSQQFPMGRTAKQLLPGGLGYGYYWWLGGGAEQWAKNQVRNK